MLKITHGLSRLQKVMADEALGLLDLQGFERVLDVEKAAFFAQR